MSVIEMMMRISGLVVAQLITNNSYLPNRTTEINCDCPCIIMSVLNIIKYSLYAVSQKSKSLDVWQ